MKMKTWLALASFLMSFALLTTNATAQDYSGEWTLDEEASELPQQQFVLWTDLTIEQGDSEMTVTRTGDGPQGTTEMTETINLEGATVENTFFGDNTRETQAEWVDGGLEVTNTSSFNNQSFTTTEVYSVNDDATVLTIETTTPGFQGGGETTSTYVYNKQ